MKICALCKCGGTKANSFQFSALDASLTLAMTIHKIKPRKVYHL
jgi:hypothetical protein